MSDTPVVVFVIEGSTAYEGSAVMSVWDNELAADAECLRLRRTEEGGWTRYDVEPFVVQHYFQIKAGK